ncbi:MAG: hypothetical protein PPFGHCPK_00908 [Spiroplasma endosymbiont of Drosophila atripex]|nr:MAG: hypothetical protein PPFGHCPK_00208 [Spiroplasma endosymbiont of Drosophila atripex]WDA54007.1 MAG: hypothetical protein PPFGHCPK_00423 [Spiroplasma endosymbiont of Drosophila atripex]WDA54447.1 MAG: hypothetical protein PPFGHCPK_00894 [Spiroplasma endosymbiont of Drosophila atripex]WDA54461.1 MAG: hypothetical protein PPFGHCPK_00908 [Spiroplasma endosymbiont of Drosophila atripex]
MAIKDPLMFITIEEFKNWKGFNNQLFDEITTPDSEIRYAIEIVSNNIDYLSGFTISKKWPEISPTKFTDNIQTATTHYVNFLLSKGVEYARGQASIGQGGIVYSQNNPEDPYFIPPQVFNYLRDINEYENMQGFPLNLPNKQSFFSKFLSNRGEVNRLIEYLKILNLKSSDNRVKINIYQPDNLDSPVVDIDTRGIKTDIDNSLWKINKDNPNFIVPKDDKGIDVNGKRIIDVGTPTFLSDATTKVYVDNLLYKKQDKLIAGENITIDEKTNIISAIGSGESLWEYDPNSPNILQPKIKGDVKPLITSNNTRIVDIADPKQPQDAVNKRYVDSKIQPIPSISQWKEVGTKKDNKTIEYNFIKNKKYCIYYNYLSTDDKKEATWICKEFIFNENNNTEDLSSFITHDNNYVWLQINKHNIFMTTAPYPLSFGKLWKLEELQE